MNAAAINVDALVEEDIRAVVADDDASGGIAKILRLGNRGRFVVGAFVGDEFEMHFLEPVRGIVRGAAAFDDGLDRLHRFLAILGLHFERISFKAD